MVQACHRRPPLAGLAQARHMPTGDAGVQPGTPNTAASPSSSPLPPHQTHSTAPDLALQQRLHARRLFLVQHEDDDAVGARLVVLGQQLHQARVTRLQVNDLHHLRASMERVWVSRGAWGRGATGQQRGCGWAWVRVRVWVWVGLGAGAAKQHSAAVEQAFAWRAGRVLGRMEAPALRRGGPVSRCGWPPGPGCQ